jgi:hypothetical protein
VSRLSRWGDVQRTDISDRHASGTRATAIPIREVRKDGARMAVRLFSLKGIQTQKWPLLTVSI